MTAHTSRRSRRFAAAALLAAIAAGTTTTQIPAAAHSTTDPTAWEAISDDAVISYEIVTSDSDTLTVAAFDAPTTTIGAGFSTNVNYMRPAYTIWLDPSAEHLRADAQAAATTITSATGIEVTVPAGTRTFTDPAPVGQIHLTVAPDSPCGSLDHTGTAGCGGATLSYLDGGKLLLNSGNAWITTDPTSGTLLRTIVLHELGHAFGLYHYDDQHAGHYQVMHSGVRELSNSYRTGDLNGFQFMAHPAPTTTVPTTNPPTTTTRPPTGSPTPPKKIPHFSDVPRYAYYTEGVKWLAANGITTGVAPQRYAPDAPVTRAQMVTFLWRMMGSPASTTQHRFADVPAGAYYTPAVRWAKATGLTTGVSATRFAPDDIVSRAQMATFLHRVTGQRAPAQALGFVDVPTNAFYTSAVRWAHQHNITTGVAPNRFAPAEPVTRGQMAAFLHRTATTPTAWTRPLPPTAP